MTVKEEVNELIDVISVKEGRTSEDVKEEMLKVLLEDKADKLFKHGEYSEGPMGSLPYFVYDYKNRVVNPDGIFISPMRSGVDRILIRVKAMLEGDVNNNRTLKKRMENWVRDYEEKECKKYKNPCPKIGYNRCCCECPLRDECLDEEYERLCLEMKEKGYNSVLECGREG